MVKITCFQINLSKSPAVYRPQETVSGNIEIEVKEDLAFNSLSISINAFGYTYWEKTSNFGNNQRDLIYSEKEEYFKKKIVLTEKSDHNIDLILEAKKLHNYSFNFMLPINLPTSFDSINAKISYNLNATLSIQSAIDTHTIKSFSLISDYNLNTLKPRVDQPFGVSESKIICCACCALDPIIATFNIKKRESIVPEISIDNKSNREISHAKIKLLQLIKFKGMCKNTTDNLVKIKKEHRNIAHLNFHNEIGPNTKVQLTSEHPLIIPPIPPTSNQYSKLIEINYSLVFTFGCLNSFDIDLSIPIKIGTELFKPDQEYKLTYQESIFDPENLVDDDSAKMNVFQTDLSTFKPFYPYFEKNIQKEVKNNDQN